MSDSEPGRTTDPPPVVRLEACLLAEAARAFLGLLSDSAVGVWGIHDEHGCGLDQVRVSRWLLGSTMVLARPYPTAGCMAYSQNVNGFSYLGRSGAGPKRLLKPSISVLPVIPQSTHEAALDVVDLADLKRRSLELS